MRDLFNKINKNATALLILAKLPNILILFDSFKQNHDHNYNMIYYAALHFRIIFRTVYSRFYFYLILSRTNTLLVIHTSLREDDLVALLSAAVTWKRHGGVAMAP